MDIYVNGELESPAAGKSSVGEILSEIDGRLESAGRIIVAIAVDGREIAPEEIPSLGAKGLDEPGRIDIGFESSRGMKAKALRTLLEYLDALAAAGPDSLDALREGLRGYRGGFSGLHGAEEESFLAALAEDLEAGLPRAQATAAKLRSVFADRLAELDDPVESMRATERFFATLKPELMEVPVRMQTGRDAEAIKTMMVAVELMNKTVRILPGFFEEATGGTPIRIGERSWSEYFAEFNDMLRELAGAFESKDGILIGDLAEYEIVPRLEALFGAALGALEAR